MLAGEVKHGGAIIHQRSSRGKNFTAGTTVEVPGMVIGEVIAREDPVCAGGLVEDCNVRLDAVLIDQPGKHLGRAVAAVTEEPVRIEIEPFERALNHAFGGQHLRLPDCRRRLDIDDDRVLDVDQVVRRVGEEGLATMRPRPACRRVGGRDELRRALGRSSESGIIEDSQILMDRSAGSIRRKSLVAFDPLLPIGIGLD